VVGDLAVVLLFHARKMMGLTTLPPLRDSVVTAIERKTPYAALYRYGSLYSYLLVDTTLECYHRYLDYMKLGRGPFYSTNGFQSLGMRVFIVSKISRSSLLFSISGRIKMTGGVKDKVGKIGGTASCIATISLSASWGYVT